MGLHLPQGLLHKSSIPVSTGEKSPSGKTRGPIYLGVLSPSPPEWVWDCPAQPSLLLHRSLGSPQQLGPLVPALSITPTLVEPYGPVEVPLGTTPVMGGRGLSRSWGPSSSHGDRLNSLVVEGRVCSQIART